MTPRCRVWAILCVACSPAAAQAPTNVNDCTLLPDPVALRRCVDGFGPQSVRPPALTPPAASDPAGSSPAPSVPQAPSTAQAPLAAKPATDWLHDGAPAAKPDRSSPNAIRLDD